MPVPPFAPLPSTLPATVPFVGPEVMERARGRQFRARLGANELTLPPSPRVAEAIAEAASVAALYPDPTAHELRAAIAEKHGVEPGAVLIGEGIDAILGLIVRLFLAPGEQVVTSLGAYPTFNYHVAGFGGVLKTVPYRNDTEDTDALLNEVRETGARMVYLCNPDNPMGSWHDAEAVTRFAQAVPEDCIVVLDEAYAEFAPEGVVTGDDLRQPNLIRLRTFSKAYGLAGMRIGYALGDAEVIAGFDRIRNHFGVSRLAQTAALAALTDTQHVAQVIDTVAIGRERIAGIARANGLTPLPSATNFVAIDCGRDGAFAKRVLDEVIARDVFIRMPGPDPLNRCIRVSVGRSDEIDLFEQVLPEALAAASAKT